MKPSSSTSSPEPGWTAGALFGPLSEAPEVSAAVSDQALIAALLRAERDLALACADVGRVPIEAASAIAGTVGDLILDPVRLGDLAVSTGNPVPVLVDLLSAAVPESARRWVHFGATSQDILDTALASCVVEAARAASAKTREAAHTAVQQAALHRDTLTVARTLGQHAVPTVFGLVAAGWAVALIGACDQLDSAAAQVPVSLGGAGGTLAAYGDAGVEVAAAFASRMGLASPGPLPWHTDRRPWIGVAGGCAAVAASCGKVADDLTRLSATDVGEIGFETGGGSSAMPHKHNPVDPILARADVIRIPGLVATLLSAAVHDHQRATGAWHAEWQTLRELIVLTGGAAHFVGRALSNMLARPERMRSNLNATGGSVMAESLAAALSAVLGRAAAKSETARIVTAAADRGLPVEVVALGDAELLQVLSPEEIRSALDPARWLGSAGRMVDSVVAAVESLPAPNR